MKHWIGTSGFQYPEWKGRFYPEQMPASKMLGFYSARFGSTEVNYSFRRIPSAKTISAWSEATPLHFRFAFKALQQITHFKKLRDCGDLLARFQAAITVAGEKVGPVLFQLPPTFKRDVELLRTFMGEIPREMRAAFEFRHESWFDESIYEVLRAGNAALCLAENEELSSPLVPTANFGYLRLRREAYTVERLNTWADWIAQREPQWPEAFIYFKHEQKAVGPKFAHQMSGLLSRAQ